LLSLQEVISVLIEKTEIHECPNGGRISLQRALVAVDSFIVISETVMEYSEAEKREWLATVCFNSLLKDFKGLRV
jgi:hypothetical protein